jgi:hypothetical protein
MEINLQVEQVVSLGRRQPDYSSIINYFISGTLEKHSLFLHKSGSSPPENQQIQFWPTFFGALHSNNAYHMR